MGWWEGEWELGCVLEENDRTGEWTGEGEGGALDAWPESPWGLRCWHLPT